MNNPEPKIVNALKELRGLIFDGVPPFDGLLNEKICNARKKGLKAAGYSDAFIYDFLKYGRDARLYGMERTPEQNEAAQIWIDDIFDFPTISQVPPEERCSLKQLFADVDAKVSEIADKLQLNPKLVFKSLNRDRFEVGYECVTTTGYEISVLFNGHFMFLPGYIDVWIDIARNQERKLGIDFSRLTGDDARVKTPADIRPVFLGLVEKCIYMLGFLVDALEE